MENVNQVTSNMPKSSGRKFLIVFEDNEAVIRMCIKGRSPNLRHLQRTRRVSLDWLSERIRKDNGRAMMYINTKWQIADMLTKGQFTAQLWRRLSELASIRLSMIKSEAIQLSPAPGKPTATIAQPQITDHITIGTDCSGIVCPTQALENMNISIAHKFSSEHDSYIQQIIKDNFQPQILYGALTRRNLDKVPQVDLYVTGFPCQPFSTAGKQQGFHDKKNQGTITFNIIEYIRKCQPKVYILESVEGITTLENGAYLKVIMDELYSITSYNIFTSILNTKDHGLPRNRSRWYCVGI